MEAFDKPLTRGTHTVVAVARHPLHPMVIPFPIAFFVATWATDAAFWYFEDPFWARASLWLLGAGLVMGLAGFGALNVAMAVLLVLVARSVVRALRHTAPADTRR